MKKILSRIILLAFLFIFAAGEIFAADLDFKTGQMIITGFSGNSIHSRGFKRIIKELKKGEISGVILFSKNIKSKDDLTSMIQEIKAASAVPAFISIDNEGGKIQRFDYKNPDFEEFQFKSAKEISALDLTSAREEYAKMAQSLEKTGINFNFAPCVDLDLNPDSIISKKERSYGKDPETVSKYAEIFIEEHNKRKIITSIKHFPGHGSAKGDTHKGFVDNSATFSKEEIMSYKNLKNYDNLNTVMVSHIFNKNFDEKYPASLSKKTIKGLLKEEIGFKGIVVSDDFDMGAIRKNYPLREIVVQAVNSGIDLMIFSNNISKNDASISKKIRKIIKEEIKNGNIEEKNIDESFRKILELKRNLK